MWVSALAVLAGGRVASGSLDNTIKLRNLVDPVCEERLKGHSKAVLALAGSPDGRLASGSSDNTVRVWQISKERWTSVVRFVADAGIGALAYAACSGVLAAGDLSGRVHFMKVETAAPLPT